MEHLPPYGGMPPPPPNAIRPTSYTPQNPFKENLVSPSPSPTLEFYGTLSPIPGARVDMTSPAPPNQLSMPSGIPQQDESVVVRLQTPTEYGRRVDTPAAFNEHARLETPTLTSMSPSRFTPADFDRQALPNFAAAPPVDGVRPHAVRPQSGSAGVSLAPVNMLPSLGAPPPTLHEMQSMQGMQGMAMQPHQQHLHAQLQLFRQGQAAAGGMMPGFVQQLHTPFRTSPVPMYGGQVIMPPQRKIEEPPMSLSPTPGSGPPVVHLPHGARIIHHTAPADSQTQSVVTPDVRHWKHEAARITEDRVQLPRQYARGATKRKPCNCKQSRCLKLYCECFAAGQTCQSCNCVNCANNVENDTQRQEAIRSTMKRSPPTQKINKKNCHCKKSNCVKKYCECYQAGQPCSGRCKCADCKNRTTQDQGDDHSGEESAELGGAMAPPSPMRVRSKRRTSQPTFVPQDDDGDMPPVPPQRPVRSKRRPSIVEHDGDD